MNLVIRYFDLLKRISSRNQGCQKNSMVNLRFIANVFIGFAFSYFICFRRNLK